VLAVNPPSVAELIAAWQDSTDEGERRRLEAQLRGRWEPATARTVAWWWPLLIIVAACGIAAAVGVTLAHLHL
jgi:hypothetical protein